MSDGPVVGVDGCGDGWLAATADDGTVETSIYADVSALWADLSHAERVLVDVPIGLPADGYRGCDEQARTLLGSQWNSVFRTPIRDALYADGPDGDELRDSRDDAKAIQNAATGTKISVQTWNIVPLIAQLDRFVRDDGGRPDALAEAHPEVVFWSLNGAQPIAYSKTTAAGRRLRLDLLDGPLADPSGAYARARDRYTKAAASDDDVVDALALAAAASDATGDLVTLPFFHGDDRDPIDLVRAATGTPVDGTVPFPGDRSPEDAEGIPMEIAFPAPPVQRWAADEP